MESKYCLMLLRTVLFYLHELLFVCAKPFTVRPRFNEVLGVTNDILGPSNSKTHGKECRYSIMKHRHREHIWALRYRKVPL